KERQKAKKVQGKKYEIFLNENPQTHNAFKVSFREVLRYYYLYHIKISFFYKTPRKQVFKKPFHRLYYKHYESYILKQKYKDIDV
ncbi:MBL fold metallo-hydrolase, partial [Campylobacter coli]